MGPVGVYVGMKIVGGRVVVVLGSAVGREVELPEGLEEGRLVLVLVPVEDADDSSGVGEVEDIDDVESCEDVDDREDVTVAVVSFGAKPPFATTASVNLFSDLGGQGYIFASRAAPAPVPPVIQGAYVPFHGLRLGAGA